MLHNDVTRLQLDIFFSWWFMWFQNTKNQNVEHSSKVKHKFDYA